MDERTRPAVMTLCLKVASDAEKLAALSGPGRGDSLSGAPLVKRGGPGSFLKRVQTSQRTSDGTSSPALSASKQQQRTSADSGKASLSGSVALTLDAFASSLAQEVAAISTEPSVTETPVLVAPSDVAYAASVGVGVETGLPPPTPALSSSWQEREDDGLLFEVELWRSDLLTSVLELDERGFLLGGGLANPLCPPGRDSAMQGCAGRGGDAGQRGFEPGVG